ncbi:hypothetical protein [Streptomyces sp. NPDC056549]|uniref:hypothetical protein n=1 Tax=Streptomyces sp. NPDC056549 TaxID=3345864 RepID=UPI0036CD9638
MKRSVEEPQKLRHQLLAIGTETYQEGFADLPEVPGALRTVVEALQPHGYATMDGPRGYHVDLIRGDLCKKLRSVAHAGDVVIVYYTGHGAVPDRDAYYLVLHDTEADAYDSALTATEMARQLIRRRESELSEEQPKVLLILDCCFAGTGASEIAAQALRGVGSENLWILASTSGLEFAQQGRFAQWFAEALRKPPRMGPSAPWLPVSLIADAINTAHPGTRQVVNYHPPSAGDTVTPPFLPNPLYEEGVAGLTTAEQHWLSRVRGTPNESTAGFYLTGRTGRVRAAQDLVKWLTRNPTAGGLAVVTGRVGTGKSALLSLPVLLNRPGGRSLLEGDNPDRLITRTAQVLPGETRFVAIHARGCNGDQVAHAIAVALGREAETASTLLEDLDAHPDPAGATVIVDAVDEAARTSALSQVLLQPLCLKLKVVVGCRSNKQGEVGPRDLTIDLDTPEYEDPEALTEYTHELLTASRENGVTTPYPDDTSTKQVAEEIAKRSTEATTIGSVTQSFLTAQLMARTIRCRNERVDTMDGSWRDSLPADLGEAFDEDLQGLGERAASARPLLEALAWARGPGLPWEELWVPAAQALADRQSAGTQKPRLPIIDTDVRWLLENAGAYIVEDLGPGGKSVFRLFHRALVTHLRSQTMNGLPSSTHRQQGYEAECEQAVTDALLTTVPRNSAGQRDWLSAHLYLRTYLAQHAAAAGPDNFAQLVEDSGYLSVADPVTLTPLLTNLSMLAAAPSLAGIEQVYRRARPLLTSNPQANAAYLEEAATALSQTFHPREESASRPWYSTLLASTRHDDSTWTLTGHTDKVNAVAFGKRSSGNLLVASAGDDGTVRIWNPVTNARYRQPLKKHIGRVRTVAFGTTRVGTLLLASAGFQMVRVWKATSGTQLQSIRAHSGRVNSVVFGPARGGRLLLASAGDDGTIRIWNPTKGRADQEPLTGHVGSVNCVALSTLDGEPVLASAGDDGTVRLWSPITAQELRDPMRREAEPVNAVAFAVYRHRLLLASAGQSGDVHIDDVNSGEPFCDPVIGHHEAVRSLALDTSTAGELRLYVADSDPSGVIRVWRLPHGTPACPPLVGHGLAVRSAAVATTPDGRPLLASASEDGTVRIWDPSTTRHAAPTAPHTHVLSVALGRSGERGPLLAVGHDDGTVQLWNGFGEPYRIGAHRGRAGAVAFDSAPGQHDLLVSGGEHGEIKLWHTNLREQVGEASTGTSHAITAAAFGASAEGRSLMAFGDDAGHVWLSDDGGTTVQELYRHQDGVGTLAFGTGSGGRTLLASGGGDGSIRLWDCQTRNPDHSPLDDHPLSGVPACGMTITGRLLVATGDDQGCVRLFDAASGERIARLPIGRHTPIHRLVLSTTTDGHEVILSAGASWVQLWDVTDGTAPVSLRRRSEVQAIAANGMTLAIGDGEGVSVLAFHGRKYSG